MKLLLDTHVVLWWLADMHIEVSAQEARRSGPSVTGKEVSFATPMSAASLLALREFCPEYTFK